MPVFFSGRRGEATSPLPDFIIPTACANPPSASLLQERSSSFSYIRWGKNVAGGFVEEGISSIRAIFSLNGLLFGATTVVIGGVPSLSKHFQKVFRWATCGGLVWGGAQFLFGIFMTFRLDGSEAERAGRRIGQGLFFGLPLAFSLKRNVKDRFARRLYDKALARMENNENGLVVTEEAQIRGYVAELDRYLDRLIKDLPEDVARKIRCSYDRPLLRQGNELEAAVSQFPDLMAVSEGYLKLEVPVVRDFFAIACSVAKIHEVQHLRQNFRLYPQLWRYCVSRDIRDFPGMKKLICDPSGREIRVLWQAARWWFVQRIRRNEFEAYKVEYEAIRQVLGGVNWRKSFLSLVDRYWKEIPDEEYVRLLDLVERNLQLPFEITRSRFQGYTFVCGRQAYPRLRFYNNQTPYWTDQHILMGAYSYLVGNDILKTSIRTARKVIGKSVDIDVEVHFH